MDLQAKFGGYTLVLKGVVDNSHAHIHFHVVTSHIHTQRTSRLNDCNFITHKLFQDRY